MNWKGVIPAVTTPFDANGEINQDWMKKHLRWLIGAGCNGIVPLGSLGEGATLTFDEKQAVLSLSCEAVGTQGVVVAGIAATGDVHPCGIDIFHGRGSFVLRKGGVGNGNLQKYVFVRYSGGIVNHGFDADLVAFFHAITEAGDLRPVGEFTAGAENVFFLIGAEKIRAVFIPESYVMKNDAGDGIVGGVH